MASVRIVFHLEFGAGVWGFELRWLIASLDALPDGMGTCLWGAAKRWEGALLYGSWL